MLRDLTITFSRPVSDVWTMKAVVSSAVLLTLVWSAEKIGDVQHILCNLQNDEQEFIDDQIKGVWRLLKDLFLNMEWSD